MNYTELLRNIREDRIELKEDIKKMISDSHVGLHAKIIDEVEKVEIKLDGLIRHTEEQGGKVAKHEELLNQMKLKEVLFDNYQKNCVAVKVVDNWKFGTIILLLVIILTNIFYSSVHWGTIWELIKKLV